MEKYSPILKIIFRFLLIPVIIIILYLSYFFLYQEGMQRRSKASIGAQYNVFVSINDVNPKQISKYIWGANFWQAKNTPNAAYSHFQNFNTQAHKKLGITQYRYGGELNSPLSTIQNGVEIIVKAIKNISAPNTITNRYQIPISKTYSFATSINADILFLANTEIDPSISNAVGDSNAYPNLGSITANQIRLISDLETLLSTSQGKKIKFIELGNEPWAHWNPQKYVDNVLKFARAIKKINPNIQVGIVGYPSTGNNIIPEQQIISTEERTWTDAIKNALTKMCGNVRCFDFVTDHQYFYQGTTSSIDMAIPSGLNLTIPSQNSLLPKYQYLKNSYYTYDGKGAINFACPLSFERNGLQSGYDCTTNTPVNITNLRKSGGDENYVGHAGHIYFNSQGKQMYNQIRVANDNLTLYSSFCPVGETDILWSQCSPYTPSQSPVGPINDIDHLMFITDTNQSALRKLYAKTDGTIMEQFCLIDSQNSNYKENCTEWKQSTKPINNNADNKIIGINSAFWLGKLTNINAPFKYNIREWYIYENKTNSVFSQSCTVRSYNKKLIVSPSELEDAILCDNNIKENRNINLTSEQDIETYRALNMYTFFSNTVFPEIERTEGIAAVYANQELDQRLTAQINKYAPADLAITEWNLKCWDTPGGSPINKSVDTIDQAFYVAESLIKMAEKKIKYANIHDISDINNPYNCSLFNKQTANNYELTAAGEAFALTSVLADGQLLMTNTLGSPQRTISKTRNCKSAACLIGGYTIDSLKTFAGYSNDKTKLYVYLFNHDLTKNLSVSLKLPQSLQNRALKYSISEYFGAKFGAKTWVKTETNNLTTTLNQDSKINVPPVSIIRVDFDIAQAQITPSPTKTPTPTPKPTNKSTVILKPTIFRFPSRIILPPSKITPTSKIKQPLQQIDELIIR